MGWSWCPKFILDALAFVFDLPHFLSSCWLWVHSKSHSSTKYQQLTEDVEGVPFLYKPPATSQPGVEAKWRPPMLPKAVIVMRHGHRQDEDDERWSATAPRPWDPPLSLQGRKGVQEAAAALADQQACLQIEYVVTSPFLRCLQTSTEIVAALKLPAGRWLVDWAMGEMCDPRLLVGGRPDVASRVAGQPIATWMWGGMNMQEALFHFTSLARMAGGAGLRTEPVALQGRPMPPYPETPEQAVARYRAELDWIMQGGDGALQGNVLVVTHGEAVRTAVTMQQPDAVVYEVNHCAYALLRKAPAASPAPAQPNQRADEEPPPLQVAQPLLQEQGLGLSTASDKDHHQQQQRRQQQQQQQQQQQMEESAVVIPVNDNSNASVIKGAHSSAAVLPPAGRAWLLACSSGETGVSWFNS